MIGADPGAARAPGGARELHARKTARQQQIPRLGSGSRPSAGSGQALRTPTRLAALASLTPAKRLDNNRSLGFARDLALPQAQGRLCGLPLGSRPPPPSPPPNRSTTTQPSALFRVFAPRRAHASPSDSPSSFR